MCNAAATATAVTTVWAGGHADDRPLEGRLGCDVDLVRTIYLGENKREKIKIVPNNKNKMKTTSDFYNNYYTRVTLTFHNVEIIREHSAHKHA